MRKRPLTAESAVAHTDADGSTHYRYTRAARLAGMVYPGGRELDIQRDSAGRISALRHRSGTGAWQPLIGEASHEPFGPLTGLTFGNGRRLNKHYDSNYAISAITSAGDGLNLAFEVDVLGQITAITPTDSSSGPEQARQYHYDAQGRLSEARDANAALIEAFSYDATGNRLSQHTGPQAMQTYAYPPDSHRLIAIDTQTRSYDAAGNLSAANRPGHGLIHFEHGAHNRLSALKQGPVTAARYIYNGQGERTSKQIGSQTIRYLYDTTGQLIGEYDSVGQPLAEYLYLDHLPVAVFTAAGLAYIETDHLGAPRVIIDAASNQAQWHWPLTGSAFGDHAPNPDPHNTGTPYTFNLRYPGQYFDQETGLHYNYFRDYEPQTGRYIQSDPIGLKGGVSTYGYVGGDPVNFIDPAGLEGVGSFNNGGYEVSWERGVRIPVMSELADALDTLRSGANAMVERNFVGADKFYHCLTMCEISSRGALDASFAVTFGVARELYQQYGKGELEEECAADNRANGQGVAAGLRNQSCPDACSDLMPHGFTYP